MREWKNLGTGPSVHAHATDPHTRPAAAEPGGTPLPPDMLADLRRLEADLSAMEARIHALRSALGEHARTMTASAARPVPAADPPRPETMDRLFRRYVPR